MKSTEPISKSSLRVFRKRSNRRASQRVELQFEKLEPRQMLFGDLVFQADFEDVSVPPGEYAFFANVSGLTATGLPVEIQHNHPSVGPASQGHNLLELDGTNGVYVQISNIPSDGLLLQGDYSPRRGYNKALNEIEVLWNGAIIATLAENGVWNKSTEFERFEFALPVMTGQTSGRLEFRSTPGNDTRGVGGLLDDIKVFEFSDAGQAPQLQVIPDKTIVEGERLTVQMVATDADSDQGQLRYTATRSPVGSTLDPVTGLFQWTPNAYTGGLRFGIDIVVTDETGLTDTKTFRVTVNDVVGNQAPQLQAIPDKTIVEGERLTVQIAATDADSDQSQLRYTATRSPVGSTLDPVTGLFQWTPNAYTGGLRFGIDIVVTDETGLTDTKTFRVTVNDVVDNQAPQLQMIPDKTIVEGERLTVQMVATDADSDQSQLRYAAIRSPVGSTLDPVTGLFQWTPNAFAGGFRFGIDVRVTDETGLTDTKTFRVNVENLNAAPVLATINDQSVAQNSQLTFTASATDADRPFETLTFRLSGTVPNGAAINPATGQFTWTPLMDSPAGVYSFNVVVDDGNGNQDSQAVNVDVTSIGDEIRLVEESRFETLAERLIPISTGTKQVSFNYTTIFDIADVDSINDAFEVALLDADGDSLVHTIAQDRDAFFNLTEGELFSKGVNTLVDGSTVTLDLSHIAVGTTATLVFRLVNNDNDANTEVRITSIATSEEALLTPIGANFPDQPDETSIDLDFAALTDVTGSLQIDYGQTSFDVESSTLFSELQASNQANHPIDGPFVLVVHSITDPNVVVIGASGVTPDGDRFYWLHDDTDSNSIAPGAATLSRTLEFFNPGGLQFSYELSVLAQPNRAPDFVSDPNNEGEVDVSYTYDANAVDPDQDTVLFHLMAAPDGLTLDSETGLINWMPTTDDLGSHSVIIEAVDGRGGKDRQQFDIGVVEDRPNRPPVIISTPVVETYLPSPEELVAPLGPTYQYNVVAVDPDVDPVSFQLATAPAGMSVDSATGLISWTPNGQQIGIHTVIATVTDGQGGMATQEYQLRVLADRTNTNPVIVSDPVDDFFVPGFSNPTSGMVAPQRISLDLGNGETFEGTVSITLPDDAARFADVVLAVDESGSMSGDQAWVAEMIPLLDAALIAAGIGSETGSPNRFAIIGFGGGRDGITVGHFLNSQAKTKYTLYGPDNIVVAEGLFNDVLPDELLNLDLPSDGRYVLVVEAQDNIDLTSGIDIGVEAQTSEAVRIETLELNTIVESAIAVPGQSVEYRFNVASETLLYFDSLAKDVRIQWTLEGPTGKLTENVNFNRLIQSNYEVYRAVAGAYTLTIDSKFDNAADYKFQVLDLQSSRVIESGEQVMGEFELKQETFAFRFNANAEQIFRFVNSTGGVHSSSKWRLVNSSGEELIVQNIGINEPHFVLPAAGEYFLLMESSQSPHEGSAQLRVPSTFEFAATISDPAPPIEVVFGDTISGEIEYVSQFVDYSFSLNQRSLVYLDSLVYSGISWTLTGPRGTEVNNLRLRDSDSFAHSSPVLDLVAGEYALRINSNTAVGDFEFRMVNLANATEITPGTAFDGELTVANETDFYRFDANGGDELYFDVLAASDDYNTQYKLIDPYGKVVFVSNRLNDQAVTTIPSSGTYTLLVEGWIRNEDADTYTINVVPVLESAVGMTLGNQVNGTLVTPGERVVFTFGLANDSLLYFDSLTNNASIIWSLAGPAGNEIDSRQFTKSDSKDVASAVIPVRAGNYQLVVQATADAFGDFSFVMQDLLAVGTTTPITPNPSSGNPTVNVAGIIAANESQLYRFNAQPGDQFSFDGSATGSTNAYYRVVDSYGTEIVADSRVSSDRNDQVFVAGGVYYLLVEGRFDNDTASEYSLDINWIQNNGPTILTGSPLALNSTINGDLAVAGQVDQFTFTLTERTLLYMDALTNSSSIRWNLHGPEGTAVSNRRFDQTDSFNNSNPVGEFVAGAYQLEVYASSGTPGAYGFRMVDLASAIAITPGTAFDGELDPANETNLYKFDAVAGDQFFFDVETVSDVTNTHYKLVDPFGVVVFISNRMYDTDIQTVESEGTYTLLVEGWHGNMDLDTYTINVHKLAPISIGLAIGVPVIGSIDVPGNVTRYTFSLADRQQIVFDSNTNRSGLNWTLDGPQGTVVSARRFDLSDSSGFNNPVLDLPAGNYQLTIDSTTDAVIPFGFTLLNLADATAMSVGDTVEETLAVTNSSKAFRFDTEAGDIVYFNGLSSDAHFSQTPYWRLVDQFGIQLFNRAFSNDFGPVTLAGGTYTLLVEGLINDIGANGEFSFELIPLGNELNPVAPTELVIGAVVSSETSTIYETDRYSFSLSESTQVYFDSFTKDNTLVWSLQSDGRTLVDSRRFDLSDARSSVIPTLNLKAGDYVLSVFSTQAKAYSFRLIDLADAVDIAMGDLVTGSFATSNETDIYRFSASAGESLFVDVISSTKPSGGIYRIVDELGNVVAARTIIADQNPVEITVEGDYWLLVESGVGETAEQSYELRLHSTATNMLNIALGDLVTGNLAAPGDTFEYEFELTEDTFVKFDSMTQRSDIAWSLVKESSVVAGRKFSNSDGQSGHLLLDLSSGSYTLIVDGSTDAIGEFGFRLINLAASEMIAIGTTIAGDFAISSETDTYQFVGTAGQKLLFDVESTTGSGRVQLRILDRLGNLILDSSGLVDREIIELKLTGTYYVLLEAWIANTGNDPYEFNIREIVTRDEGAISFGTAVVGAILIPGEQVVYTFDASNDVLVHFDSHVSNADITWSLKGPRGIEYSNIRFDRSDATTVSNTTTPTPAFELRAGSYTLTVDGTNGSVGDFGFNLINLSDVTQSTLVTPVTGTPVTVSGTQVNPSETQVFRFDGVAGDQFSFDSTVGESSSHYRVLDSFGTQVFIKRSDLDQGTVSLPRTGTYFLLVEGDASNTTVDTFSIDVLKEGNVPVPGFSGVGLTLGSTQNGDLDTAGQVDSYTFTLSERSLVYMDMLTPNSASVRWNLTGPRGVDVFNRTFTATDSFNNNDPVLDLIAGDYLLEILAFSGTPGAYAFTLADLMDAASVVIGTSFSGELTVASETDLYQFEATAGQRFYFDVEAASDVNNTDYKLIDRYGQVVLDSNRLRDHETVTIPRDGTYTLLVEGIGNNSGVDTYTMNIVPFVETPKTLLTTGINHASINTVAEQLVYEFSLTEDRLLYVDPLNASADVTWTLQGELFKYVDAKRFNQGIEFVELSAGDYTITVDGMEDYLGDTSLIVFATSQANQLETDGSITVGALDSANGVQVFQFDGIEGQHFALMPDFGMQFTDSATAAITAGNYIAGGEPEDGYSGLDAAFRADVFRDGAAINYILVTDEDRDVAEDNVTFESLFQAITAQSALLNMVTTAQFRDDTNTRAIGVDSEGTAYIADGVGGFTVGTGGYTTTSNVSFRQDYIDLAWSLDGANWDLGLLRAGGVNAESFTNAFIDVKVEEILEQTALRLISSNIDADFEVTDPLGGIYSDFVGGATYDFEVRVGNNGQPISYDLLFKQGQTVGSIPVFIISPYQYGAMAVDADGDSLIWSIADGPQGLMIDADTGILSWTADSVFFGEHEITIRVDDGRGGFDEQSFVLDVNGGEAATISGRVVDLNLFVPTTVGAVVPGASDPYLAGLPDGTTASGGDIAPDHSPMFVDSFLTDLLPGTSMTFAATGGVFNTPALPNDAVPDGTPFLGVTFWSHNVENGFAGFNLPINSLVGVFLSDDSPDTNPAAGALDFSPGGNVVGGINYTELSPELQQIFFIGDGVNDDGTVQEVVIPEGASRFYLGTADQNGWYDNSGAFEVEVTARQYMLPEETTFTVYLDQNRNGLFDDGEQSTTTDANGNYAFSNIGSGSYVVTLQPLEGWRQQIPGSGPYEISVDPGKNESGLIFGNEQVPLVNSNPVITSNPILKVVAGERYAYTPTAVELDGDDIQFDLPLAPAGMAVNPDNGVVRWTPRQDQIGIQNVLLRVRDEFGGFDLQYFQIVVAEPNSAPVITSTPPTGPAGVGLPFTYDVNAVDAQDDAIAFSLSSALDGMTIDSVTGVIFWTPTSDQVGTKTISIVALDERGLSSEQTFELAVVFNPVNLDPVFLSEPPVEVRLGDNYLYIVNTFDQNGDPTTLSLEVAPAGMTLDANGLVHWMPGPDQLGEQTARLTISDGRGGTAVQEFTIKVTTQPVNFPPEITSIPLTAAIAGESYSFHATAIDRNKDTLIWTLENAPMGMSIDALSGLISWNPELENIGEHAVTVQVMDTYAAYSQLIYTLRVRAVNTPPVILSAPPTSGAIGSTYLYQVGAEDIDQDRLMFSLVSAPTGMIIDAQTGLLQWTPGAGQDGPAEVEIRVSDSIGASVSQSYTIQVADGQPNQLPVITSVPGFFATVGGTYTYQIAATDLDGDVLTYTLLSAQPGMTVDSASGLLQWTPTATDLGTTFVEIVARDPALGGSIQKFSLTVLAANSAPEITSTPPSTLASGQPFRYDVLATDGDGEFLIYELVSGPEGMVIDGLGRMFWIPQADQLGDNAVEIKVSDPRGAFATQAFNLTVAADTTAPQVVINLSDNPVDVGSIVDIRVQAIDNVGVESLLLTVDGEAVPLDSNGNARLQLDTVGSFTALATATDDAGNSATDSIDIFVADPNDVDGPVISIGSPGDGDSITAPTDVIGSVMDDTLVSYRLLLGDFEARDFKEIGSGTENIENGVLGQIDPTLLQNGSYILRLEAFDAGGNGNVIEQGIEVTSDVKVGDFGVNFVDLVSPVNGQPIIIGRSYNSLAAGNDSEVGFGWNLDFRDTRLQVTVAEASDFDKQYGFYTPYQYGTRVYVTLPGGQRQGFTFTPETQGLPGLIFFKPKFTADPGVTSRLTVQNTALSFDGTEFTGFGSGQPYNPAAIDFGGVFTLKTMDGTQYTIDADTGFLKNSQDQAGNTLTYSRHGIISSSGIGIQFEYNAAGRVSAIVDVDESRVSYAYSTAGDLTSMTDKLGNVTTYQYLSGSPHFLDQIIDPLGRTFARSIYDENGRLISVVDANGNASNFDFDLESNVETVTDALGNSTIFQYNNQGYAIKIVNADGGVIQQTFNDQGQLLSRTDSLGNTISMTFDSAGNQLTQTDALGNATRFINDGQGNVTQAIDALGNVTTATFVGAGNPSQLLDASGVASAEITYDDQGNPVEYKTVAGGTAVWDHDGRGNITKITDAMGAVSNYFYDARGRLVSSEILADGLTITESRVFDAEGRILNETSADGGVTTYEYDAVGNLLVTIDPLGRRTEFRYGTLNELLETIFADSTIELDDNPRFSFAYDALGRRISQTDESGRQTLFEYDSVGRLTAMIYPDSTPDVSDNARVSYEYDLAGRRTAEIDAIGNRTEFEYDANGRNTLSRNPYGDEVQYFYDQLGRVTKIIDQNDRVSTIAYDAAGRERSRTLPDGTVIENVYDDAGRPTQIIDAAGNVSTQEFNNSQLVAVIDALGKRTEYSYNQRGFLETVTDALGHSTTFAYDTMGRQTEVERPLGGISESVYDLAGNLVSLTDSNGDTIEYVYDARNRVISEMWEDGTNLAFTYSLSGELLSVVDAAGTQSYSYDASGRLISVVDTNGHAIEYQYDDASRETAIVTADGTVSYAYDALNRVVSVTDSAALVTTYAYDAVGQLVGTSYADGLTEVLTYNVLGQLTTKTLSDSAGAVVLGFVYTYDAAGNRVRVNESSGRVVEFTYDAANRLVSETDTSGLGAVHTATYSYDAVGNRVKKIDSDTGETTYIYDANDRLTKSETDGVETQFVYDANGNLLTTSIAGSLTATNTWDGRGRLIAVDQDGDGIDDAVYFYDAFGVRTSEIINGTSTDFLVDSNRANSVVLAEFDSAGETIASMVYGRGLISRTAGASNFFHTDAQGTVRIITDVNGNQVGSAEYDAFGIQIAQSGILTPYGYTGERTLFDGTIDLRARHYDPGLGRFLSADSFPGSMLVPMTLNRYLYGNANPTRFTDPSGQFSIAELSISQSIQNTLKALKIPNEIRIRCQQVGIIDTVQASIAVTASLFTFFTSVVGSAFLPDKFAAQLWNNPTARGSSGLKELNLEVSGSNFKLESVNGNGHKAGLDIGFDANGNFNSVQVSSGSAIFQADLLKITRCGVTFAKLSTSVSTEDSFKVENGSKGFTGHFATTLKDSLKLAAGFEVGGKFIGFEKDFELASLSIYLTPPFSPGVLLKIGGFPTWQAGTIP